MVFSPQVCNRLLANGVVYGYLNFYHPSMALLTAQNIHKRYGTVEILKGVDITIERGEVASIVGSSGAGKSTLLHILGTLDKADKGTVVLNGATISGLHGNALAHFR